MIRFEEGWKTERYPWRIRKLRPGDPWFKSLTRKSCQWAIKDLIMWLLKYIFSLRCLPFLLSPFDLCFLIIFRFIEKFGTHIIVGVKMGGKDVVFVKQQHSSSLQPAEVQKKLKEIADKRFVEANGQYEINSGHIYQDGKVFFSSIQCLDSQLFWMLFLFFRRIVKYWTYIVTLLAPGCSWRLLVYYCLKYDITKYWILMVLGELELNT